MTVIHYPVYGLYTSIQKKELTILLAMIFMTTILWLAWLPKTSKINFANKECNFSIFIFRRKIFPEEIFQFSSQHFSLLFLKVPMTRRLFVSTESLVSCTIQLSGVTVLRKPEYASSNSPIDHLLTSFPIRAHFFTTKKSFFDKNLWFFGKKAFFHKKTSLPK